MSKENKFETGQESIENVQNLFQELLLLDDIDSERRLLEKHDIYIDENSLEVFHQKKKELLTFVKENRDKLLKLTVEDLEVVQGGDGLTLTYRQLLNGVGKAFAFVVGPHLHGGPKSVFNVIFDAVLGSMCANLLLDVFVVQPNADVFADVSSKLGSYSNSKKTNANKKS